METIKIQISEVEGMTVKIPTEFTAYTFNKFYEQMLLIGKSMPNNHLIVDATPERLKISSWPDKDEALTLLNIWETQGKEKTIVWMKEVKDMELDRVEISKLSALMAGIRCKYKKELSK